MNAVLGMTQLALQTSLTPEQRHLLTQADASARALLALVDDALDVARIEAGQARLEPHPFRLEDVVAQALDQVRPLHA
jgi:signal transduction histidine kinase